MSRSTVLARGRRAALAGMLDTFDIKRSLGVAYDPEQDADVETFELLFTTAGRLTSGTMPRNSEVGGRTSVTVTRELQIPYDSPAVPTDAVAVCVAVDDTSDPTLLDATLRLDGPSPASQTTARRLQVSEVVS